MLRSSFIAGFSMLVLSACGQPNAAAPTNQVNSAPLTGIPTPIPIPAPVSSPYTGTWSGDWISSTTQKGTMTITVANDGTISGTVVNTALNISGITMKGKISSDGTVSSISYTYPGNIVYYGVGNISLDGNGQLIGGIMVPEADTRPISTTFILSATHL